MSLAYKWFMNSHGVRTLCTLGNLELRKFTLWLPGSQLVKGWEEQELKKKLTNVERRTFQTMLSFERKKTVRLERNRFPGQPGKRVFLGSLCFELRPE